MTPELGHFIFTVVIGFTSIVFFVLTLVSARRGPRTRYLALWVLFCALVTLFTSLMVASNLVNTDQLGVITVRAAMSTAAVALTVFLAFALSFTGWTPVGRVMVAVAGAWVSLLFGLFWGTRLVVAGVTHTDFARFSPVVGPGAPVYLLYIIYCWFVPLFFFIRAYRRSTGLKRTQAAYMLVAFGLGCVASVGTILPAMLETRSLLAFLPALVFPLFPLTITYAIVRHRLWDVRTIMHKTTVWLMLMVALVVPVYVVFWAVQAPLSTLGRLDQATLLMLLFLGGFVYVQSLKPRLDHLFQRRVYDWRRVLDRFSRDMAELVRPRAVSRRICDVVAETLYPERVTVYFRHERGPLWEWVSRPRGAAGGFSPPTEPDDPVLRVLLRGGTAVDRSQVELDPAFEGLREEARRFFERAGAQVCVPLVHGEALQALVFLDVNKNLRPYTRADLEFLEQLAAAATIGLSNGLLFEKVDRQRADLKNLTENLEQRVQERTWELEDVNRKLLGAYEKLQEVNRLKARFFANISHELRTPLTLILAPLDSLLDGELGPVSPALEHQVKVIRKNGLSLLKLINNLLDLSRIEASRMHLRKRPLELAPFVEAIVEQTRPLARQNGVRLSFEQVSAPRVLVDEEKMERVMINLLSNALKFTERGGGVTVVVGDRGDAAFAAVQDTGIGIPAEELPYVFDRFRQVDSSSTRAHGGTGIGLALVQELVKLHGGAIRVQSEVGRGSTFTVNLPMMADEQPATREGSEPQARHRWESDSTPGGWTQQLLTSADYRYLELIATTDAVLEESEGSAEVGEGAAAGNKEGLAEEGAADVFDDVHRADGVPARLEPAAAEGRGETVLVVEDNQDLVNIILPILARHYRVLTAENGAVGWRLARRELPSLVLCDMMMPVMDGVTLCRRLRSHRRTKTIPVIMITARTSIEDSVVALDAGADDYVTKPFSLRELMARISAQLRTRQLDQAMSRSERMAALGSTAGGMAHEILNPLNAIINGLEVLAETDDAAVQQELMPHIQRSARRILETVEALKAFVRQGEGEWGPADLNAGVEETLRLLSHLLKGITVQTSLELDRQVYCYGAQINQVVMNLVCNAADVVGPGGTIRIATRRVGAVARITVRDDGPGVAARDRERIFYPYFTTKPVGKGTGMGLSIARQIVDQHNGSIRVTSPPDQGAELAVELPLRPRASQTGPLPLAADVITGEVNLAKVEPS